MSISSDIKNEYFETVSKFISEFVKELPHTEEDEEKIKKMLKIYSRKRDISGIGRAQNPPQ